MASRSLSWRRRSFSSHSPDPLHPLDPSILALLHALLTASREIKICKRPLISQRLNATIICRRIGNLSDLFQEITDSGVWVPPSAMASFRRLRSLFHSVKALLHNCRHTSNLLLLMEQDSMSAQFHRLSLAISRSLSSLPYDLLEISQDVKDQVSMVQNQASKAHPFLDSEEKQLRDMVLDVMAHFETQASPDSGKLKHILERLHLNDAVDCERELSLLEKEKEVLKADEMLAAIRNINNLISFVRYARCVLYGLGPDHQVAGAFRKYDLACRSMKKVVFDARAEASEDGSMVIIPEDFRCPISLELMVDPVVVASGQSYDRSSITRWLEGHTTCPKTGLKLVHTDLIPNASLKRLIMQWCAENDYILESDETGSEPGITGLKSAAGQRQILQVDNIPNTKAAMEATKLTAQFLVQKLEKAGTVAVQRQAAYELRLMAKEGMDNRACVAAAGAIHVLSMLIGSTDKATQENAVTALLNISLYEKNKEEIMVEEGAVDGIVGVLRDKEATEAARENAAAALFSLTTAKCNREEVASKKDAIEGLLELMKTGRKRGKKDAILALLNIGLGSGDQANLLLKKGTVLAALEILESQQQDADRELIGELIALLGVLARRTEGLTAINAGLVRIVPQLIQQLSNGSNDDKERTVALLLAACSPSDLASSSSAAAELRHQLLNSPTVLPALRRLIVAGTPRAQRKSSSLLKLLQRYSLPVRHQYNIAQ